MMRSVRLIGSLTMLLATACDDLAACPAIYIPDLFTLVLDDQVWEPADFVIELSYEDDAKTLDYTCAVSVPAIVLDRDAGAAISDADAGADDPGSQGQFSCTSEQATAPHLDGKLGRAIVLTIQETPKTVRLKLLKNDEVVLDAELQPEYKPTYPHGRDCGEVLVATERISF